MLRSHDYLMAARLYARNARAVYQRGWPPEAQARIIAQLAEDCPCDRTSERIRRLLGVVVCSMRTEP